MPTYEYLCPEGHAFEVFQKMSEEPGADCPECGAAAQRQFSAGAGFIFKGEGFYITDYRSDSYKKAAARENSASDSGSGSDSGSSPDSGSGSSSSSSSGSDSGSSSGSSSSSSSGSGDRSSSSSSSSTGSSDA